MSVIPTLSRLRQGQPEFEASKDYIAIPSWRYWEVFVKWADTTSRSLNKMVSSANSGGNPHLKGILGKSKWEVWVARDAGAAHQYLQSCTIWCLLLSESVCLQSIKCSPRRKNSSYHEGWVRCDRMGPPERESGSPLQRRRTKEARAWVKTRDEKCTMQTHSRDMQR